MRIRGFGPLAVGALMLSACQFAQETAATPPVEAPAPAPETTAIVTLTQGEWTGYAAGDRNGYSYTGYFCDSLKESPFTATVAGNRITGTIISVIGGTVVPVSWKFDGEEVTGIVYPLGYASPRKVRGKLVDGELRGTMVNAGSSTCSGMFVLRPVGS